MTGHVLNRSDNPGLSPTSYRDRKHYLDVNGELIDIYSKPFLSLRENEVRNDLESLIKRELAARSAPRHPSSVFPK